MNIKHISLKDFTRHLTTMSALEYLIEVLPECGVSGPWIAGGALHRTYRSIPLIDSDVDFYFKDISQLNSFIEKLKSNNKYTVKNHTINKWHNTVTIQYMDNEWDIQCISFLFFEKLSDMFSSFDINVCMLAYDGKNIAYEENTLNDIRNNSIKFNSGSINYPGVTLKRMVKYLKMGYNIDNDNIKILSNSFYKNKNVIIDLEEGDVKKTKDSDYKNVQQSTSSASTSQLLTTKSNIIFQSGSVAISNNSFNAPNVTTPLTFDDIMAFPKII